MEGRRTGGAGRRKGGGRRCHNSVSSVNERRKNTERNQTSGSGNAAKGRHAEPEAGSGNAAKERRERARRERTRGKNAGKERGETRRKNAAKGTRRCATVAQLTIHAQLASGSGNAAKERGERNTPLHSGSSHRRAARREVGAVGALGDARVVTAARPGTC